MASLSQPSASALTASLLSVQAAEAGTRQATWLQGCSCSFLSPIFSQLYTAAIVSAPRDAG